MTVRGQRYARVFVAIALLALPVVLLLSSLRATRELDDTTAVFLRNRAATSAARLENLRPDQRGPGLVDLLASEEPSLVDLRIYASSEEVSGDAMAAAIWNGETLFHTAEVIEDGERLFVAYVPFHTDFELLVARILLDPASASFLVEHSRHHLMLSLLASLALVLLTVYFLWSERRRARLERMRIGLEHLAHLGKMSAVLAHEIRNPLGTIKGFVQLALERADSGQQTLLRPVLDETSRLEKLVTDLLAYGRPKEPNLQPASWPAIAAQMTAHARDSVGDSAVQFRTEGDLDEIRTDPDMLVQVLLNLVRNAVEAVAGQPDGEVVLSARRNGRHGFLVEVEDNGPGMPEEVRSRLFEPFTTTKTNGAGLGLSIARNLTTALGGEITFGVREPRGVRATLHFKG